MQRLKAIVEEIDFILSSHALYVSKLERAIRDKAPFEHKDCFSCNFGKMWQELIVPNKDSYPPEIRQILDEIEKIHCEFHETSMKVNPLSPQPSDEDNIHRMKDLSSKLFHKLLKLKRMVKELSL